MSGWVAVLRTQKFSLSSWNRQEGVLCVSIFETHYESDLVCPTKVLLIDASLGRKAISNLCKSSSTLPEDQPSKPP